ncbi:MAG TPA: hypothetical protein VFE08_08625, partial [Candidatus Sulfotelmatobacter sp.]|nr:hypothetical protein [Candidatus Sulfotelmatobacter sp.]
IIAGTQKGNLETPRGIIRATNKKIRIDGVEFFTFYKQGKLTNLVTVENMAQILQQIKDVK